MYLLVTQITEKQGDEGDDMVLTECDSEKDAEFKLKELREEVKDYPWGIDVIGFYKIEEGLSNIIFSQD